MIENMIQKETKNKMNKKQNFFKKKVHKNGIHPQNILDK